MKKSHIPRCRLGGNYKAGASYLLVIRFRDRFVPVLPLAMASMSFLGNYATKEEAARVRRKAELELWGQFAPR